MKPLLLKMSAFGPYAKPLTLNFKEDLDQQDIFVVTGPTGAGKTTIFDAICYALYGETSGGSRSGKELRSDFVKESEIKTEVSFTFSVNGKTYCITRSPQQLQKKKRGEGFREVPATVEFLEVASDYPPLTKESEVREQIQQIIGLKIEQFRKIVMIPQGDFKEFLVANTTNKEEILRKIFGTDFYKAVQEQLTQQANRLKAEVFETQQAMTAELQLVRTDENQALDLERPLHEVMEDIEHQQKRFEAVEHQLEQQKEQIAEQLSSCQQEYELKKKINEKIEEYATAKERLDQLTEQQDTITRYEHQVSQAKQAQGLINLENECLKYQAFKQDTLEKQAHLKKQLTDCQTEYILVKKCYDAIDVLRQEMTEMNREKDELSRYVEGVKLLDQKRKQLQQLEQTERELTAEVQCRNIELAALKDQVEQLDPLNVVKEKQREEQHRLELREVKGQEELQNVTLLCEKLEAYEQTAKSLEDKEASATTQLEEARLKREDYEHQAQLFINAAAIRLANELKVGQPCPVCGSCDHPNPRRSQESILSKATLEAYRVDVEKLEERGRSEEQECSILRVTLRKLAEELNHLKTSLIQRCLLGEDEEATLVAMRQLKSKLLNQQSELTRKKTQVLIQVKQLEEQMAQLVKKKEMMAPLEAEIAQKEQKRQDQRDLYQSERRSVKDLEEQIPMDYRSVDVLMSRLEEISTCLVTHEQHIKKSQEDYERVCSQLTRLTTVGQELTNQLEGYESQLKTATTSLEEQIVQTFLNRETYEQAKSWIDAMDKLEQFVIQYYQERHTAVSIEQALRDELAGAVQTDLTPLKERMEDLSHKRSELEGERARVQANREQNERLLSSVTKKYAVIQSKEKEYATLGELDALANGRSGRRMSFETYVLSSYFDEVLFAANLRLQKMTARRYYLLRREEVKGGGRKGLDLDVYDSHTCNQRPVNTLSGGESFKASLALALGLCDVVQQNSGGIQLDTMFIDEGFGTLDSESLDQAIDILMDLQDHGRLIGIISHVNELKERIPVKLVVEADGTGSCAYFKK